MSDTKIHLLPFSIDREGTINTKEYFSVEKDNDQYETTMLGRKLVGTPVTLVENTVGHVWEKKPTDHYNDEEEEDETSTWSKTNITIEEFMLWKKDRAPNAQDPRINTLNNWMDITQTVCIKIASAVLKD